MTGVPEIDRETLEELVERTIRHVVSVHPDMEPFDPNWLEHPLSSHEAIHRPTPNVDLYDHGPAQVEAQLPLEPPAERYRVGRKLGRTVYDGEALIGIMDTANLAAKVVAALNASGL